MEVLGVFLLAELDLAVGEQRVDLLAGELVLHQPHGFAVPSEGQLEEIDALGQVSAPLEAPLDARHLILVSPLRSGGLTKK